MGVKNRTGVRKRTGVKKKRAYLYWGATLANEMTLCTVAPLSISIQLQSAVGITVFSINSSLTKTDLFIKFTKKRKKRINLQLHHTQTTRPSSQYYLSFVLAWFSVSEKRENIFNCNFSKLATRALLSNTVYPSQYCFTWSR